MTGQTGAVAAGALNPGQALGPESAQPAQKAGVASRGDRNSRTPSSPPTGSSAAATCTSASVSTPPVTARISTMDNAIPFLRLTGWHAPAGRQTREPRPLAQDGQIRPAAPAGARNPGARPADHLAGQHQAPAESEARPGPSALTLRPYQAKPRQQRRSREHLSTSSLPNTCMWRSESSRPALHADLPDRRTPKRERTPARAGRRRARSRSWETFCDLGPGALPQLRERNPSCQ